MGCGCQKCVGPSFFSIPKVESMGDTLIKIEHERLAYELWNTWEQEFRDKGQEELLNKITVWIRSNTP